MNTLNPDTPTRMLSKRKPLYRFPLIPVSVIVICLSFLILYHYYVKPNSQFSRLANISTSHTPQCSSQALTLGEKFMWYAPHSGFSNQLSEFKNAVLMAGILNRTLVVPPILDHHAVALGSCPKFRVLDPKDIRISVWDHVIELVQSRRYISIAEIIDISSLVSSSLVRVIDFRDFVSIWCGISLDLACITDTKLHSSVSKSLKQCGSLLAGLHGSIEKCIYAVNEDCRTTVWTYHEDGHGDGMLDSFQPDEQLKHKKKISYVRRRKDVFKTLGPGSEAGSASLLAFGTLFSATYKGSELYVDIHESHQNQRFLSLGEKIKLLSFVPEILIAGKEFVKQTIRAPFLCAQLRLLDGQFKNHQKATFQGLRQKLESLRKEGPLPVHIFIMTDLPGDNWTDTYLGDLVSEKHKYKVYFLNENDKLIKRAAIKLMTAGHGQRFLSNSYSTIGKKYCSSQRLPDLLLYVEQTVCSCASLGFVGTPGSTIAENIELMRRFGSSSQKC
ncbi:hypothetical protein PHAVU_004G038100 [Phaseolus vulgaris]|uniref:Uncharacterized protein n=1 Tax=Phaseolus vulgaris TaxID=3885 RepID=V7C212_PHAVU|nr:hypothetical protein PHAVU_004G038100g [Phaseolus vulgaris]ESW23335.1 hypothetical protein PHAVU_004G038100g [Phaseolus vulgaris]